MGDFVTGNRPLPARKVDARPPIIPEQEIDAADVNDLWDATNDLRTHTSAWVNVKSYDAKGDGVTDDTAALQAAVAALPVGSTGVVSGGELRLPNGIYNLGSGAGWVIPAGLRGLRIVGASKGGTILKYTGTGTALTVGTSTADTVKFFLENLTVDISAAPGGANAIRVNRTIGGAFRQIDVIGRLTGADSGTGIYFDGTGNWTGSFVFDGVVLGGSNFTTGISVDASVVNSANRFHFRDVSVSRQFASAKPGTGTVGILYGVNAGDGITTLADVENYDTGYQVNGRYLIGQVRAENNGTAINFGAASVSNTLWLQPFTNTVNAVYTTGQAYNSVIDAPSFNSSLNNGSATGSVSFREPTDHDLEINLQSGATADKRARFILHDRNGAITHIFGKDQFNRFVVYDQTGYQRIVVGGYFATNDPVQLMGEGTGAIQLNVGNTDHQGTGGVQWGNGLGVQTGALNPAGGVQPGQLNSGGVALSSTIWSGSGIPSNTFGANGDFYLRSDTPGTVNQRLYVRSAGAWTGIL